MLIGLCGGSGSGKGAVCAIFGALGIPSVDTDKVYHDITSYRSECLIELAEAFGEQIIRADGTLDRARLADIVFTDGAGEKKILLEKITHKHILAKTRQIARSYNEEGYESVIVDAPLLFESGFDKECDTLICVCADSEVRIERIIARDGISRERAQARISKQLPDSYLISKCDYCITNNGDLRQLELKVKNVYKKIKDRG